MFHPRVKLKVVSTACTATNSMSSVTVQRWLPLITGSASLLGSTLASSGARECGCFPLHFVDLPRMLPQSRCIDQLCQQLLQGWLLHQGRGRGGVHFCYQQWDCASHRSWGHGDCPCLGGSCAICCCSAMCLYTMSCLILIPLTHLNLFALGQLSYRKPPKQMLMFVV